MGNCRVRRRRSAASHRADRGAMDCTALVPILRERVDALCQLFLLFPVSSKCLTSLRKNKIKSEGRQPFLTGRWSVAYVSPFNTARQFCNN